MHSLRSRDGWARRDILRTYGAMSCWGRRARGMTFPIRSIGMEGSRVGIGLIRTVGCGAFVACSASLYRSLQKHPGICQGFAEEDLARHPRRFAVPGVLLALPCTGLGGASSCAPAAGVAMDLPGSCRSSRGLVFGLRRRSGPTRFERSRLAGHLVATAASGIGLASALAIVSSSIKVQVKVEAQAAKNGCVLTQWLALGFSGARPGDSRARCPPIGSHFHTERWYRPAPAHRSVPGARGSGRRLESAARCGPSALRSQRVRQRHCAVTRGCLRSGCAKVWVVATGPDPHPSAHSRWRRVRSSERWPRVLRTSSIGGPPSCRPCRVSELIVCIFEMRCSARAKCRKVRLGNWCLAPLHGFCSVADGGSDERSLENPSGENGVCRLTPILLILLPSAVVAATRRHLHRFRGKYPCLCSVVCSNTSWH